VLDQRGQLLRAALGFAGLPSPSYDRALWSLRTWLDSWSGIGRIAVGVVMLAGCAAEGTTRILSYYGDWTGVRPGQRPAPHTGLDFDASRGDPVIAARDGTVVRVFVDGLCGNGIVVQHLVGGTIWRTAYCHLDETDVQPGQQVKRGDVLGKVGTTGHSLGVPHLHFGLLQPGGESFATIDPLPFIVGCFDPAKTVTYSTLEASGAKPRPVLTYPVWCAGSIK
jgi:murein DD-endopeptidase MepM/ murein hydrolase activator NlpD